MTNAHGQQLRNSLNTRNTIILHLSSGRLLYFFIVGRRQVVIADAAATWGSNVTLSVIGSIPVDHSLAIPPLDILLLLEAHSIMSEDLELLAKLMPGLAAEVSWLLVWPPP